MPKPNPYGVPGLQKRNGWWILEYRWTDPVTGERHRIRRVPDRGLTDAQVKRWAERIKAGALAGNQRVYSHTPRVHEAVRRYLKDCVRNGNREGTVERKTAVIRRIMAPVQDRQLGSLHPEEFVTLWTRRMDDSCSPATAQCELALYRHFLRYCARNKWAQRHQLGPIMQTKAPKVDERVVRCLTRSEEDRLLYAAPKYLQPVIKWALNTGMRRGEILSLQWSQIDAERRTVTIKGDQAKSRKTRVIPLNEAALRITRSLPTWREWVFLRPSGEPLTRYTLWHDFNEAADRAGVPNLRFHDLRATFATRLAAGGVGLLAIRDLLGHSSLTMAQKYVRAASLNLTDAVSMLDH